MKTTIKTIMAMAIIAIAFVSCKKGETSIPTNTVSFSLFGDPEGVVYVYQETIRHELTANRTHIRLTVPVGQQVFIRRIGGTPSLKASVNDRRFEDVTFENNKRFEFVIRQEGRDQDDISI